MSPAVWIAIVLTALRGSIAAAACLLALAVAVQGVVVLGNRAGRTTPQWNMLRHIPHAAMVVLALSTFAQSMFGLDSRSGMTRYRLLPLRGWEIILAKDIAFVAVLLALVIFLNPLCGIAAGMAALAFGNYSSVFVPLPQRRWRFTGCRLLPVGALQGIACFTAGILEGGQGPVVLLVTAFCYIPSLFRVGARWARRNASD